jgi:chromate transporter
MIYLQLFWEFFKIGLFTFGGGYAMIPLLKEAVLGHNWLSEEQFYDFLGVTESTPGPTAVNMATYVGSTQGGILGSLIATFGVVLPSFIIILLIAAVMKKFIKNKYVQRFLEGLKPVVLGLILSTGLLLLLKAVGYQSLTVFVPQVNAIKIFLLLIVTYFGYRFLFHKKMSTILLIAIAAVYGLGVCGIANLVA